MNLILTSYRVTMKLLYNASFEDFSGSTKNSLKYWKHFQSFFQFTTNPFEAQVELTKCFDNFVSYITKTLETQKFALHDSRIFFREAASNIASPNQKRFVVSLHQAALSVHKVSGHPATDTNTL